MLRWLSRASRARDTRGRTPTFLEFLGAYETVLTSRIRKEVRISPMQGNPNCKSVMGFWRCQKSPASANPEFWSLLALPDGQLEQSDLIVGNLLVARGVEAFESLDTGAYTRTVENWTNQF